MTFEKPTMQQNTFEKTPSFQNLPSEHFLLPVTLSHVLYMLGPSVEVLLCSYNTHFENSHVTDFGPGWKSREALLVAIIALIQI